MTQNNFDIVTHRLELERSMSFDHSLESKTKLNSSILFSSLSIYYFKTITSSLGFLLLPVKF